MEGPTDRGKAAVAALIALGAAVAFASAVVPHYGGAFRLQPLILFSGLTPYLVYGVAAQSLRGRERLVPGAVILGLHVLLVLQQRWPTGGHEQGGLIYWFPLVLTGGFLAWQVTTRRSQQAEP